MLLLMFENPENVELEEFIEAMDKPPASKILRDAKAWDFVEEEGVFAYADPLEFKQFALDSNKPESLCVPRLLLFKVCKQASDFLRVEPLVGNSDNITWIFYLNDLFPDWRQQAAKPCILVKLKYEDE